jgi:four helix bundle protein
MKDEMLRRTKEIALKIILFCDELPSDKKFFNIQKQLIRSASSVGANYRVVRRAKSSNDFIHKLTIVEEEADETLFWLELLSELYPNQEKISPLY